MGGGPEYPSRQEGPEAVGNSKEDKHLWGIVDMGR